MCVPPVVIQIEIFARSFCENRRLGQSQLSSEILRGCLPTAAIMASLPAGVRSLHGRPVFTNVVYQNNKVRILVLQFQLYCYRQRWLRAVGYVRLRYDRIAWVRLSSVSCHLLVYFYLLGYLFFNSHLFIYLLLITYLFLYSAYFLLRLFI